MTPFCVVLIVLEKGGFIVSDQDEVKATNCASDWEPIWVWEFCPIIVLSMESSLMSHPTLHKSSPVFHHICPLVPIKIVTVLGDTSLLARRQCCLQADMERKCDMSVLLQPSSGLCDG